MNVVIMGVAGSGKTTVGVALAAALSWRYLEGDTFHSEANRQKMAAGNALNDDDRWPWLDALVDELNASGGPAVLSCSALKSIYRDRLRTSDVQLRVVWLSGTQELIAARLAARRDHYMPPSLLASQLAALEPPEAAENAIVVDIDQTTEMIVAAIISALQI